VGEFGCPGTPLTREPVPCRALHIDASTGEYAPPYVRDYTLDVEDSGAETAEMNFRGLAGKTLEPVSAATTLAPDDDFDATMDGAYSVPD
jgi:hypothetical protein